MLLSLCALLRSLFLLDLASSGSHKFTTLALTFLCVQNSASQGCEAAAQGVEWSISVSEAELDLPRSFPIYLQVNRT